MTSTSLPFLPYGRQLIEDDDVEAVTAVLRGDWLTTGPAVGAFEEALAARVGARYAVACSSGTAALHLAALALGLGPGDVVIVPALTFLATANAARFVGAEVCFADVDADSGLVSDADLARALDRAAASGRGRVRAVFPVHLNGQVADMPAIAGFAAGHGLRVVEDASHALGSRHRAADGSQAPAGACRHADLAVFSFHPVKTIAMGEGGAVTTNDEGLWRRLLTLRSHGIVRAPEAFENHALAFDAGGEANPWYYEMPEVGLNYRASDIHCALGLSQLGKLDRFVERRRALAARYDRQLAPLAPAVRPVARVAGNEPAWHLYAVLVEFEAVGKSRARVMGELKRLGVGTQVHYLPLHLQPYYAKRYGPQSLPGAEAYYRRVLSLPLFASMTTADVDRVVEALASVIAG